jgi:hypothetical protein
MTMVVRDEEDILAANLDYHLGQGVDVILVVDHGSEDATPEILRQYERSGQVRSFREDDRAHDQVRRVNRLVRLAEHEHAADWIMHGDADEFWLPAAGCLRDVFAAIPDRYGFIQVERNDFLPVAEDSRPFHERIVVRERRSRNLRGEELEGKVAQRPGAAASVMPGNHELEGAVMEQAPDIGAVQVGHFSMRSFAQFERKVIKTGVGYEELAGRGEGIGSDQLELLRMQREGELRAYYDGKLVDPDAGAEALASRGLVVDDRLRASLSGACGPARESPWVQRMLRSAWLEIGASDDARGAAELRAETIEKRVTELERTIEQIKTSRVMRYSASARRVYYRLRPGAGRRP